MPYRGIFVGLLLALAACDGASSAPAAVDGGTASPEPPPVVTPEPAPLPGVSVVVTEQGRPARQTRVVFHDGEGRLVGDVETDNDGRASRSPAPSNVTVISKDGLGSITFTEVADGDVLTISGMPGAPINDSRGSFAVQLPGPVPGASDYWGYAGTCGWGHATGVSEPLSVGIGSICGTPADKVLVFSVTPDSASRSYAWQSGLIPVGGAVTVVPTPWTDGVAPTTFTPTGPAPAAGLQLHADVSARVDSDAYSLLPLTATPISHQLTLPKGFASVFATSITIFSSDGRYLSTVVHHQGAGPFVADTAEALPFPEVTAIKERSDGTLEVTWKADPAFAQADAAIVSLRYRNSKGARSWTFVVPPGRTSVRTLAVGGGFGGVAPGALVGFVESDAIDGYAAFKKIPTSMTGRGGFDAFLPAQNGLRARTVIKDDRR